MTEAYVRAFQRINRIVYLVSELCLITFTQTLLETKMLTFRLRLLRHGFSWAETDPDNIDVIRAKARSLDEQKVRTTK